MNEQTEQGPLPAFAIFVERDGIWHIFNGEKVEQLTGRFQGFGAPNHVIIRSSGGTMNVVPIGNIVKVTETSVVMPG